jgi:hypothetical protein
MRIKTVYPDYIQKSRLFLYPALDIKRGVSVTPIQTYLSWKGKYEVEDCRFIVRYHMRDDQDFRLFEEVKLLGNPLFVDFYPLDDDSGAYVFDYKEYEYDFMCVAQGKYSMLSPDYKRKIMAFFKNHASHHVYLDSYLHPQKYFRDYAEALTTIAADIAPMKSLLEKVGELCSIPDLEEETLKIEVNAMKLDPFPLNL